MKDIATLGSKIKGMTTGEHHGHYDNIYDGEGNLVGTEPRHSPCELTGEITGNCSTKLYINGKPVAIVGSTTTENDCCGPGTGVVATASSRIYVNGVRVAMVGDKINPHNGDAEIISGEGKVGDKI